MTSASEFLLWEVAQSHRLVYIVPGLFSVPSQTSFLNQRLLCWSLGSGESSCNVALSRFWLQTESKWRKKTLRPHLLYLGAGWGITHLPFYCLFIFYVGHNRGQNHIPVGVLSTDRRNDSALWAALSSVVHLLSVKGHSEVAGHVIPLLCCGITSPLCPPFSLLGPNSVFPQEKQSAAHFQNVCLLVRD